MRRLRYRIIWPCVLAALVINCRQKPTLSLRIDSSVSGLFTTSSGAPESQPPELKPAPALDELCAAWPKSQQKLNEFVGSKTAALAAAKRDPQFVATMAGCNSWYELTDRGIEMTFLKSQQFDLDKNPVHCLSVGFLQPWVMLSQLNCERLTFIDLNPNLIRLQMKLVNEIFAHVDDFDFQAFIKASEFPFAISQKISKPVRNQTLELADICGDLGVDRCKELMKSAAKKLLRLSKVEFVLGPLHTAVNSVETTGAKGQAILYASNALDEKFMTEVEFNALLKVSAEKFTEKRSIIYHMASGKEFGIYEIGNNAQLQILCSDPYTMIPGFVYDPCFPKRPKPGPVEILNWADKMAQEKIGKKQKRCSQ